MKSLITKLNPTCKKALEEATILCKSKGHYSIELEHFLYKLIQMIQTDIQVIFRYYEIDCHTILRHLKLVIEKNGEGNQSTPALSKHILTTLEQAWLVSSLNLEQKMIRSASILLALIDIDTLRGVILDICPLFLRLSRLSLRNDMQEILKVSTESVDANIDEIFEETKRSVQNSVLTYSAISSFTINLTEKASKGELDKVIGRNNEISQIVNILARRRQNNPILVGDAGVGKTAIIEALAQKIALNDIANHLKNTQIRSLDLSLLFAGASFKGELEQRLKNLFQEISMSEVPIILFIDEAHMFMGNSQCGSFGDLSNMLKPALARGNLRIITATTWSEYKRLFERDAALSRRFEKVKISEPTIEETVEMLRVSVQSLQDHHNVKISNDSLYAAALLSYRFLPERRLPDKAVCVLDTACAQVALSKSGYPKNLQYIFSKRSILNLEKKMLLDEFSTSSTGGTLSKRLSDIESNLSDLEIQYRKNYKEWQEQLLFVSKIQDLENEIKILDSNKENNIEEVEKIKSQICNLNKELNCSKNYYVRNTVDQDSIADVIEEWTGIPKTTVLSKGLGWNEEKLMDELQKRIFGQLYAIKSITNIILQYQIGLNDEHKPIGVFFLVGPSGVGKTETATAMAEVLMGHSRNLIRINMSEFQDPHSTSTLKGAPPGYAGYGRGGTLTESVRQNPYSIILLDEVDKAHPDILNLFCQIFDKGVLEDSAGTEIDFSNTIFVLTSNDCSNIIQERCCNIKDTEDIEIIFEKLSIKILQEISDIYGSSLTGRTIILPYMTLSKQDIENILKNKIKRIEDKMKIKHRISFDGMSSILKEAINEFTKESFGARSIDRYINKNVLPKLTKHICKMQSERSVFSVDNIS